MQKGWRSVAGLLGVWENNLPTRPRHQERFQVVVSIISYLLNYQFMLLSCSLSFLLEGVWIDLGILGNYVNLCIVLFLSPSQLPQPLSLVVVSLPPSCSS